MNVYQSLEEIKSIKRPVLTLGMFDGAHIGHQSILKQLNTIAKEIDGESVLITFNPHPRMVLQPNCDLKFLNTLEEKENELRGLVQERILILTEEEIDSLVYEKWFGGLIEEMISLIEKPLKDEMDKLKLLNDRYKSTLDDLDEEYS